MVSVVMGFFHHLFYLLNIMKHSSPTFLRKKLLEVDSAARIPLWTTLSDLRKLMF
jgi:hypothetical protein